MLRFLLAGVPQFVSPWHVEAYMASRRLEQGGVGARHPFLTDKRVVGGLHYAAGPRR